MEKVPVNTINRLIKYRTLLNKLMYDGREFINSHHIGKMVEISAAMVRRDLMYIGANGNPNSGYKITELENKIAYFIDPPDGHKIAIVGIGNLGTSLLKYLYWRCSNISSLLAFDSDPRKIGTEIDGVRILDVKRIPNFINMFNINLAILTLSPEYAQNITDKLVSYGIKGIINYTAVHLDVPNDVILENRDIVMSIERISVLTRQL
jgi:redox-sensing transcriptional repressor